MVSGAAALLSNFADLGGLPVTPSQIRNALVEGAVALAPEWSPLAQGAGYVNVPNALAALAEADSELDTEVVGALDQNVEFDDGLFQTTVGPLLPGRTQNLVFEVDEDTALVVVQLFDTGIPTNAVPVPDFGLNKVEFYVHSAKRSDTPYILDSINVFGDSLFIIGDDIAIPIGALTIDFAEAVLPAPMEPGLMKVTVEGDFTNSAAVTTGIRIFMLEAEPPDPTLALEGGLSVDEPVAVLPVDIPAGTSEATFRLRWDNDWSQFPTNDLDMFFFSPGGFVPEFGGATLDAPELVTIQDPEAGLWTVLVIGFEISTEEEDFNLEVTLE